VFTGWYTTPTFDPETRITEIPAGTEGVFNVYAKWNKIIVFEDYSSTEINHSESNKQGPNSISYNGASCPGSSFITKTDAQGVSYLEYSRGEKDPRVILTTGEIASASNTSISYELVIGKDGDKPFGGFLFRTLAKQDVNGNALASNNQLYMFMIDENGACLSNGGDKTFLSETKFAEFEDDKITVRVVLDFKNCLIIGVGADGTTVSVPFDIPASSGATNGIEYMKTFSSYVFYLYPHGKANSSARIYSIKVTDGDIYTNGNIGNGGTGDDGTGDDDEVIENKIAYEANGGVLPKNAPKVYDKNEPTVLPTPSKTNYVFLGWYTSSTFEDETLVTEVPTNTEGNYAVYAKWLKVLINENYEQSEFSIVASSSVVAGIKYNAIKGGASFETKTDENGNTYLEWYKGENDPILSVGDGAIAKMSSSLISYEIVMAKNGSEIIMASSARTMAQYDKDGNKLSDSAKIQIFGNTSGGEVYLASNREKMLGTIPADGSTFTVRVVIDFENLQILGYLDDGTVISTTFKIPEATGVSTGAEFQALFTTYVFYWQGSSAAPEEGTKPSLRVESIKICEGNIFAS
jgi:uncharacterized repeat protein (TIGR02543 family)